jgi:hypothetical protein
MKRSILSAIVASGLAFSASAQEQQAPPAAQQQAATTPENAVENVIVTAPRLRSERALNNFITTHAAATPFLGKIARWKTGICPITVGLTPELNVYISQRILRVALAAGAPLAASEPCRPNIAVLATPEPQKLLDFVRTKRPALLGFHYRSQAESIASMKLAVQAWYSTATEDFLGMIWGDLPSGRFGEGVRNNFGDLPAYHASGSRLGDGLKSVFTTAIIVVDIRKIGGQEVGPLADYIAVLALSQGRSYDDCQSVPTITNLMAPNCDAEMKPAAITDIDMTFLRGLYRMRPDGSYRQERGSIAFEMKKDLGGY